MTLFEKTSNLTVIVGDDDSEFERILDML